MHKIAVFPGSFDPFTLGHESIIKKALPLFDKVIIAIGYNSQKETGYFPIDKRVEDIKKVFINKSEVSVQKYDCLTVDLCEKLKAKYIIRGIRNITDFEYEKSIAQTNIMLNPNIETIFFFPSNEYSTINSSIIRDIIKHGGDASKFVPKEIDLSK